MTSCLFHSSMKAGICNKMLLDLIMHDAKHVVSFHICDDYSPRDNKQLLMRRKMRLM